MMIPFMMLSKGKTSSQMEIGLRDPALNESWDTKWEDIEELSINARFSQTNRYTNSRTSHRRLTTTGDYKWKERQSTQNTNPSFPELLLHNEKDSSLLDDVLVTITDDIVKIIEKLKDFSKPAKFDGQDLKTESEDIQESLNTIITCLQSDWNTLYATKERKICTSKSVIKEVSRVKHVLYKLIEIFWSVKYQFDLIFMDSIHHQDKDIYSLFNKLFRERFSIHKPFKYFKKLEDFITRILQSPENQLFIV